MKQPSGCYSNQKCVQEAGVDLSGGLGECHEQGPPGTYSIWQYTDL